VKQFIRFLIIPLCFFSYLAIAETHYIHDVVRIDMRSGPTTGYRIINFLKSGTPLEILNTSDDKKWVQVNARGKTGWVQTQFLTKQPIARTQLIAAQKKLLVLTGKNKALQASIKTIKEELNAHNTIKRDLESSNSKLSQQFGELKKTSQNALNTAKSYRKLQEKTELLNVELEKINEENKILASDNLADGIELGVLAVIIGIIVALMIPRLTSRKQRSNW